jgi:predicted RNase H-like HicB family nuclease
MKYSFTVHWSERDGEWVARCPAFPGLSGIGRRPEDALTQARVVLWLFIDDMKASGEPLPAEDVLEY